MIVHDRHVLVLGQVIWQARSEVPESDSPYPWLMRKLRVPAWNLRATLVAKGAAADVMVSSTDITNNVALRSRLQTVKISGHRARNLDLVISDDFRLGEVRKSATTNGFAPASSVEIIENPNAFAW